MWKALWGQEVKILPSGQGNLIPMETSVMLRREEKEEGAWGPCLPPVRGSNQPQPGVWTLSSQYPRDPQSVTLPGVLHPSGHGRGAIIHQGPHTYTVPHPNPLPPTP